MQSVVITGADGFIGRNLLRYISGQGVLVYALVLENSPNIAKIRDLKNVIIIQGDLLDWQILTDKLPESADAFIHLAWAGVAPDERNSIVVQKMNIDLCLNAVQLASKIKAKKFILPGSTLEYAYCGTLINDKALPSPQNVYGAVKTGMRYICQELCHELQLPYIYVVITSIYGADRIDNNVISYTIKTLLNGDRPALTRLTQLWDYVHIDDVVYALYLIAKSGKADAFYAVGHGDNWPLANYIYTIRDLINPELPLGVGEISYKDSRQPSSCVDLTALQKDTGFKPQINFETGIKRTIEQFVP